MQGTRASRQQPAPPETPDGDEYSEVWTPQRKRVKVRRRMPVGAELLPDGGVHFRVWAPRPSKVEVVLEGGRGAAKRGGKPVAVELDSEPGGYRSGWVPEAGAGTLYRFRLDDCDYLYPDPASRYQPQGPHGPSQVIDPDAFPWSDAAWKGAGIDGQIVYEMHVGTFTPEGTWEAATRQLPELARIGITVLEVMPVSEFPGRFGWGYDGVDLFAPTRLYGDPDDFRRFVDQSHSLGLAVILDVVYNHLGPDGNYLGQFSQDYFTSRYENEWGDAINFDGDNSGPVREFFVANAGYWIDEFHLDGLRLDATQSIHDGSPEHVLAEITRRVRAAARGRATILVGENEPQHVKMVRPLDQGGYGLDALWNDDFHHTAHVALTARNEAYYTDYLGTPQEMVSAMKYGFLYQGQRYRWQKKRRGTPTFGLKPATFVIFLQNHDQVANSERGLRHSELTSPGRHRAMTALMLLGPGTPMLFQGQEFRASSPFVYFADHEPNLAKLVARGRARFLAQFPSINTPEMRSRLPDPTDPAVFERCKLNLSERETHAEDYLLHQHLIVLRRKDPVFSLQGGKGLDGAVMGPEAFLLRFFGDTGDDRLLLVNLGRDLHFDPAPEPLLAPPEGSAWAVLWSSESPDYGGRGQPPVDTREGWRIPGESAVVLAPRWTAEDNQK
jgi:maltooligosyltrehalose trehalohydrolase